MGLDAVLEESSHQFSAPHSHAQVDIDFIAAT